MKPTWLLKKNKLKLNDELTAKNIELNNKINVKNTSLDTVQKQLNTANKPTNIKETNQKIQL